NGMMALPMRRLMGAARARSEFGGGRKRPLAEAVAVPPIRTVTASATPTVNTRRNFTSGPPRYGVTGVCLPKRFGRSSGIFPEDIDGNHDRQTPLPEIADEQVRARQPQRSGLQEARTTNSVGSRTCVSRSTPAMRSTS